MNRLDHLVIATENLDQGVDYIRSVLGVEIPKGGFHQTMGTHNHIMQLGNEVYLELIAINPEAPVPRHPRWFGLDEQLMRQSIRQQPRLITWMINTTDISLMESKASFSIGKVTELTRNNLRWQVGLSGDGRLLGSGLLPHIIQWHNKPHPANAMADLGCRLLSLDVFHNRKDWLKDQLISIDALDLVTLHELSDSESPFLSAQIETPLGKQILTSKI